MLEVHNKESIIVFLLGADPHTGSAIGGDVGVINPDIGLTFCCVGEGIAKRAVTALVIDESR